MPQMTHSEKLSFLAEVPFKHKRIIGTIVCTPSTPLSSRRGKRGLSLILNFQKRRGLDRISTFRGWLLVKKVVTFFQGWGGAVFT